MDLISITMLLEYLYKKFAVTFILCLIGSFIKDSTGKDTKLKRLDPKRILSSAVFASVLMCAVVDYVNMPFSIYIAVTVIAGIWSPRILDMVLNIKFMKRVFKNLFKSVSDPVAKAVGQAVDDMDKEDNDKKDEDDESSDKE